MWNVFSVSATSPLKAFVSTSTTLSVEGQQWRHWMRRARTLWQSRVLRGIAVARRARMAGLADLSCPSSSQMRDSTGSIRRALRRCRTSYFEKIGFTSADASELPPDLRRSLARTSPRVALKIMQVTL
jgi:hypothetical protein